MKWLRMPIEHIPQLTVSWCYIYIMVSTCSGGYGYRHDWAKLVVKLGSACFGYYFYMRHMHAPIST